MKILFINNPVVRQNDMMGTFTAAAPVMLPYGLLSLAGYLLHHQLAEVRILDNDVRGLTLPQIIEEAKRWHPDIVGVALYSNKYRHDYELVHALKQVMPNVVCCGGGPHATMNYTQVLQESEFDYCIVGEGEIAFGNLIRALSRNQKPTELPGVAYYQNGKVELGGKPQLLDKLDELPFPAYHLLANTRQYYRPALLTYRRLPVAMIISSRGCPFACSFCTQILPKGWRAHTPEYLFQLCEELVERQGYREITFFDDTFAVNRQRVLELCRLLSRRQHCFPWSASINLHTVDEGMICRMKEAGCWLVHVGIESGDDRVLKFINKPITVATIRRQVEMIHRHGIMVRGYFILGLPTDTRESMQRTIDLAQQLPLYVALFSLYHVAPGSPLAQTATTYGSITPTSDYQTGRVGPSSVPPFLPHGLTATELNHLEIEATNQFFFSWRRLGIHLRNLTWSSPDTYGRLLMAYLQIRAQRGQNQIAS